MNQSLTHNKSSHGRFRGSLKSLEKLTALQTLRHVYGTLIEGHEKRSSGHKQPDSVSRALFMPMAITFICVTGFQTKVAQTGLDEVSPDRSLRTISYSRFAAL